MAKRLRILLLEDEDLDADLIGIELKRAGIDADVTRVITEAQYRGALDPAFDLILSDYALPQFSGLSALTILRERGLDIPFIVVSGTISEQDAGRIMSLGARSWLLKENLDRLGASIRQTLG